MTTDNLAYKLNQFAAWKIQQESASAEPSMLKLLGHLSVYRTAIHYMDEIDNRTLSDCRVWSSSDTDIGELQDIEMGGEEGDRRPSYPLADTTAVAVDETLSYEHESESTPLVVVHVSEDEMESDEEEEDESIWDDEGYSSYEADQVKDDDDCSDSTIEQDDEMEMHSNPQRPKLDTGSLSHPCTAPSGHGSIRWPIC